MSDFIHTSFEEIHLIECIGRSLTTEVWRASFEGHMLAVKILHHSLQTNPRAVERMGREAQVLARLSHPNIPRLVAAGLHPRTYIAMTMVEGATLDGVLGRRARRETFLSIDEILHLFKQLCAAVHHAHQNGVVHRDLKPGNLRIEVGVERPKLTVLDFGIAKLDCVNQDELTTEGRALGSPIYWSPEQAQGVTTNARADVFAAASILFELLTLRRAWARGKDGLPLSCWSPIEVLSVPALQTIVHRLQFGARPSAVELRPELAPEIDSVLRRAWRVDSGARYPTLSEFYNAAHLALVPSKRKAVPLARPAEAKEITRKWTRILAPFSRRKNASKVRTDFTTLDRQMKKA